MRELLFRAQTRKKGDKVWMNGNPVDGNWVFGGIFKGEGCYSVLYTYEPLEKRVVYTDPIGQYTGMTDKNGVKIFEGDILKLKRHIYDVEWKDGCLYAVQKNFLKTGNTVYYKLINLLVEDGAEVIGNIYDTPELLENIDYRSKA